MKKANIDLVVGGSILASLIILIGSVLWLKEVNVTRTLVQYTVLFPNIGTLAKGDPVMVNGVKKGIVSDINLYKDSVAVRIEIDKQIRITDSTRITVQNIGLMGERMIGIQLSAKGIVFSPHKKNAPPPFYIHGYFDTGIAEAMGLVGTVVSEVELLLKNVTAIVDRTVGDSEFVSTFSHIVGRLDTITTVTQALIRENSPKINTIADNAETISSDAVDLLKRNQPHLDTIAAQGAMLTTQGVALVAKVDSMATKLKSMLESIDRGEGSAGKILKDEKLYTDIKKVISDLDSLLAQVSDDGLKLRLQLDLFGKRKDKNKEIKK